VSAIQQTAKRRFPGATLSGDRAMATTGDGIILHGAQLGCAPRASETRLAVRSSLVANATRRARHGRRRGAMTVRSRAGQTAQSRAQTAAGDSGGCQQNRQLKIEPDDTVVIDSTYALGLLRLIEDKLH
jgi:hypothetical protein